MGIIDQFISKLAPHDCVGCGNEGDLLCGNCAGEHLRRVPGRCYRCRKISSGAQTCQACRKTSKLAAVHVAVVYDGLAKELVWQLKFKGAQAAATEMIRYMRPLIGPIVGPCIVPVPTATSRVRRRGYDQAKLLARELSKQTRLPYADCLVRSGQAHQVGATRQQRLHQLTAAFRVSRPVFIRGCSVILVDDVITTGATLEAAALALKESGAKQTDAIVFAQP